jgi:hypothetical protein
LGAPGPGDVDGGDVTGSRSSRFANSMPPVAVLGRPLRPPSQKEKQGKQHSTRCHTKPRSRRHPPRCEHHCREPPPTLLSLKAPLTPAAPETARKHPPPPPLPLQQLRYPCDADSVATRTVRQRGQCGDEDSAATTTVWGGGNARLVCARLWPGEVLQCWSEACGHHAWHRSTARTAATSRTREVKSSEAHGPRTPPPPH